MILYQQSLCTAYHYSTIEAGSKPFWFIGPGRTLRQQMNDCTSAGQLYVPQVCFFDDAVPAHKVCEELFLLTFILFYGTGICSTAEVGDS